jgi:two-component system cell cycle response regulator DivK
MEKTVLICDDDADILEVTKTILSLRGYTVETMMNTDDLIPKVESLKPSVILMDLWIPDIGGSEATRQLKANPNTNHIPVIIFSANNDIEKVAASVGANGFLRKPFEIADLERIIGSHISK